MFGLQIKNKTKPLTPMCIGTGQQGLKTKAEATAKYFSPQKSQKFTEKRF
jgi:hypothetical protein